MRTHTIDNTTIEYPDQIGFCFNPVIINILGGNYQSVTATVTDTTTATSDRENRATFGGNAAYCQKFFYCHIFPIFAFGRLGVGLMRNIIAIISISR
jgi:hypothetical protein